MGKESVVCVWVICYISSKNLNTLNKDLRSHRKYMGIKSFIPMVRVLKKRHKNVDYFDDVPFLFNYGFFRVPKYFIANSHFLDKMRKDIGCIYAWVYDKARINEDEFKRGRKNYLYNPKGLALVTQEELVTVKRMQGYKSIFTKDDVDNLYPGKVVILKGYPFDDLEAEVVKVYHSRKKVQVRLLIAENISKVMVSYENIFFTIYNNQYMNTEMKESSFDELKSRGSNIDNLMFYE